MRVYGTEVVKVVMEEMEMFICVYVCVRKGGNKCVYIYVDCCYCCYTQKNKRIITIKIILKKP